MTATLPPQNMIALAYGDRIRMSHAAIRRHIRTMSYVGGLRFVADLLESPDDFVGRMRVRYLLESIHWVGHARAASFVHEAGLKITTLDRRVAISRTGGTGKTIGIARLPLSERGRTALAEVLRARADGA